MRVSKEFRALARQRLKGQWGIALLASLVASLLGGASSGGHMSTTFSSAREGLQQFLNMMGSEAAFLFNSSILKPAFIGIGTFSVVIFIGMLIIGSAVQLGHSRFYIGLAGGESPQFSVLFSRFHIFLKALGLRLYMGLFIFLWSLLFIIPGIIAFYRYSMAPYLMAQYPDKGIAECMDDSKALMIGHKSRLFFLHWSFIGWALLNLLTLGIGSLWLTPYMQTAEAAFYLERTNQLDQPF